MHAVSFLCIRYPKTTLIIAAVIMLAVSPGVLRLRLRTDGHALVPHDAPQIAHDRAIRDEFGIEDPLVVILRTAHPDGIFNEDTLCLVAELTEELADLDGVRPHDVFSLATEYSHRVIPGTLTFRRFLDPLPKTPQHLTTLRDDLRVIPLYRGTLISFDETATSIMVGTPRDCDRVGFYSDVRRLIELKQNAFDRLEVIGAPAAEALLGHHLLQDLGVPRFLLSESIPTGEPSSTWPRTVYGLRTWVAERVGLVPVALAIMALVFLAAFRSVVAVALPLAEVGAAIVFVFALMGWFDVPVYLTLAVLPVILTAVGVADEIHIFSRYRTTLRNGPPDPGLRPLLCTMSEMAPPVVKTSVTTAIGFLSFALSPIGPVQAFGVFTAVGVVFCMVWSLTVVPACLAMIDPSRLRPGNRTDRVSSPLAKGGLRGVSQARENLPQPLLGTEEGTNSNDVLAADAASGTIPVLACRSEQLGNGIESGEIAQAKACGSGYRSGTSGTRGATSLLLRGKWAIVLVAVAVMLVAPAGARRVQIQDSWIDGFAPASPFRKSIESFNRDFLGMHTLFLVVDAGYQVITGELTAPFVDHHTLSIPIAELPDSVDLRGWHLRMRMGEADGAGAPLRQGRRPVRERKAWVESTAVQGDRMVITIPKIAGSPKISMQAAGVERLTYELTPQRFLRPEFVKAIDRLTWQVRDWEEFAVGGALGTGDYIATTNLMARGLRPEEWRLPDRADRIHWLWSQYERIRGTARRRQVVDDDYSRAVVSVFLKDANFRDTAQLMAAVRQYEKEHLAPLGLTVSFAGDVAVSQALIDGIVQTQTRSLLISLVGVALAASLLNWSLVFGLLAVLPCAMAVLCNFALMGWIGMPLGVATSMFAGMTLGIGVDFAIHLLERYRVALRAGAIPNDAVAEALAVSGPAILTDGVAVALGFGALMLSQVPANARLGILVVSSIVGCLLATLVVLPAVLSILRPGFKR